MATDSLESKPLTTLREYRLLGHSGLRVSPMCLGTMTFGESWGSMGSDEQTCRGILDAYYSRGGNFFDTANVYQNGVSEEILGRWAADKRSQCVIATKYSLSIPGADHPNPNRGGNSRKSLAENLDLSLKRLGMDYVDLLYVHIWEYRTPPVEVVRSLDDVVRSGKALYVGISDTPAWMVSHINTIADLRGWSPFIALQTRYNMLDRSMENDLMPMAKFHDIGLVAWGILAEGFLTGKHKPGEVSADSGRADRVEGHLAQERNLAILQEVQAVAAEVGRSPAQVCTNWVIAQGVECPLVGSKRVDQVEQNLGSLDFTLSKEQIARLNAVSAQIEVPFPHSFARASTFDNYVNGGCKIAYRPPFENLIR